DDRRALVGEAAQPERLLQDEGRGATILRQAGAGDISIERTQGPIELGREGLLEMHDQAVALDARLELRGAIEIEDQAAIAVMRGGAQAGRVGGRSGEQQRRREKSGTAGRNPAPALS